MSIQSTTGHYANMRKRFVQNGLKGFLDYEVIELLLKLSDNRRDQKNTAKRLIKQFKSLKGVLSASNADLLNIQGIGPSNIFGLKFVHAVADRYLKENVIEENFIRSSNDVIQYLTYNLRDRNREAFLIIYLNGRNQILEIEQLFEGSLTSSAVYSREVIKGILQKDAASIILVHNHPSGNPNPSKEDQKITKKLIDACKSIDVTVHDHIIIAGNHHTSFVEQGLI
ncbi:MAG: DNA repair protein RadC [Candidatus Marinimicrobia bacterium]|nr:DNA repair protein RadC [Candidatus Neomarinimicrobiota bacterium]